MRFAVIAPCLLFVVAACDEPHHAPPSDAMDDPGVRVTGCDDPAVWTAPALGGARVYLEKGATCGVAEYPLSKGWLGWGPDDGSLSESEKAQVNGGTVCWRLVDAQPGSGWAAGQQFTTNFPLEGQAVHLMGFDRSVTVEGRILFADGTLAFATDTATNKLAAANIVEPDASAVVAVMSPEAWAESNAVVLSGEHIPTDPVLDGIAEQNGPLGGPHTLNRTAQGLVLRSWSKDASGTVAHVDTALGQGTKARFVGYDAIVIDAELVIVAVSSGTTIVQQRFPLGAEPLEAVGYTKGVVLHMNGSLVAYDRTAGLVASRTVGDGVLIVRREGDFLYRQPMFLEGTMFKAVRVSADSIELDNSGASFLATAGELAALGKPAAVYHSIVFGENGLLSAANADMPMPGPRFASFAELVGDGHLGPISADTMGYVIKHADGTAELYRPPYYASCL